ncbi:MAG: PEP-CTERM sorting domain-containing protein [Pseudanabaena sp.]
MAIGFLATLGLLSFTAPANALSFNLNFDNTADNTLSAPFVGTGTFSFTGNVSDGTYTLTSLPDYNFNITFGTTTFTNANITTTPSTVLAIISGSGTGVKFSNNTSNGAGGSIDFINGINDLSFEPPSFGGNLNLYFANVNSTQYFGNYGVSAATPTPVPFEFEPTGAVVVLGGLWGLKRWAKKKKSQG